MSITLAFDVYGTLIDTQGVVAGLERLIGDRAASFSQAWRDKQLEYSFRRGLMQSYEDFGVCTSQALDYTCLYQRVALTEGQKADLLASYGSLPAFGDVAEGLGRLQDAGYELYAFSNGTRAAVDSVLKTAGISSFLRGMVSCDDLRTFKPNPDVYRYFLQETNSSADKTWLVSSNPFDVIGAVSAGLCAAWV
ncbi:MAG: haloacid dehalogenase type II, partial [Halieaceae bacterium]|nr:haloacid dehalogenase type II [Halieaceae bacterium]